MRRIHLIIIVLSTNICSVVAQVSAKAGPDQTTCVNKVFTLTGSGLNAGDTGAYQWKNLKSGATTNSKIINQIFPSTDTIIFELTVTRIHNNITYTDKDTCIVFVNGLPQIILPRNDTICSSAAPIQLRSNYPAIDTNGRWSGPFVNGSYFDPSLGPKTKQYEDGGNTGKGYKLVYSYTDPLTKCTNKDSMYKIIQSQPEVVVTSPKPYQQCEGQSFHMSAVVKWASAWSWSTSGDGSFTPGIGQLNPNYNHGIMDTMTGTVKITVTTNKESVCPQAADNVTLIVEPYPQFSMPPHMVQCEPAYIDFNTYVNKPNGSPNLRYSWDFGNGQTLTNSKTGNPQGIKYPVTKEGWYDVRLTVTNQWGADSSKACSITRDSLDYVRVLPQPRANFSSDPNFYTTTTSPQFTFKNTSKAAWGKLNYIWNFDNKLPDDTSTQTNPVHNYLADTSKYWVTLVAMFSYYDASNNYTYTCWDSIGQLRVIGPKVDYISLLTLAPHTRIAVILPFNGTLYLYDFIGRTIETRTVGSRRQEFDISGLASGMYYFAFYNGSIKQTLNFIKY